jgi:hypothetical protein
MKVMFLTFENCILADRVSDYAIPFIYNSHFLLKTIWRGSIFRKSIVLNLANILNNLLLGEPTILKVAPPAPGKAALADTVWDQNAFLLSPAQWQTSELNE